MIEVTNEQIADVLDDAADYIEKNGWCQKNLQDKQGQVCSEGAVRAVVLGKAFARTLEFAPEDQDYTLLYRSLKALRKYIFSPKIAEVPDDYLVIPSIPLWNDDPNRTKQKVLDTFRACAKELRS